MAAANHPSMSPSTGPATGYTPLTADTTDGTTLGSTVQVIGTFAPLTTTLSKATTSATANAFLASASVAAPAAATGTSTNQRKGGSVQYQGSGIGYVFFGTSAPSDITTSIELAPGQILPLSFAGGGILQDPIWIASSNPNERFVFTLQS